MKLHHLIFLSITSLSLATNSLAQESEDPIQHYEIEFILYKNAKVPKSNEYILPVSSPKKDSEILDLSLPSSIQAAKKKQYRIIPRSELQLTDIVEKISRSPRYEILLHTGWRQPGVEKPQALPVWIKAGRRFGNKFISIDDRIDLSGETQSTDAANNLGLIEGVQAGSNSLALSEKTPSSLSETNGLYELEGKITISLSRYLHVYTDLVLRKPRRTIDSQLKIVDSDQSLYENLADTRILDNHRLNEHRRMRSKTLHYLDNPEFSMLIFITPYNPSLASTQTATQVEMLVTDATDSN